MNRSRLDSLSDACICRMRSEDGCIPRTEVARNNVAVQPQPGEKTSMQVEFSNMITGEEIRIGLGLCTQVPAGAFPDHWAWAETISNETWLRPWGKGAHDCATDHIEDWPQRSREFGSPGRTIRLSFAPCSHAPDQTLVLGIELSGRYTRTCSAPLGSPCPPVFC